MKRVLASLRTGAVSIADGPTPGPPSGGVLVQITRSLVSAGTERMLIGFGRSGWLAKAASQPGRVRQTIDKARTEGIAATWDAVRARLNRPVALGYSAAGRIVAVDRAAGDWREGDRVAVVAPHATHARVMPTMLARVPDGVDDEAAAFGVVGAIGLNGMRLIAPTLGESVAVIGLGLIGLLAAQLLRAGGARVIGIDPDPTRCALGDALGVAVIADDDPVAGAVAFSKQGGVDAVLITAATSSRAVIGAAARMCRARGRIVLTGVAPLHLSREEFYAKELTFQVSAAYGPGRYDPAYEGGSDYPLPHVRWTMARNIAAVLDQIAAGRVTTEPLVSHRFAFDEAHAAYELLANKSQSLGILIGYPDAPDPVRAPPPAFPAIRPASDGVSVIGSGQYAARTLVPAFAGALARFRLLIDNGGPDGPALAARHGFAAHRADVDDAFADEATGVVVIATRHESHAALTARALRAGRHVFVEKPLALSEREIADVEAAHAASARLFCVGFNRRFSPHMIALAAALRRSAAPPMLILTVNAGALPPGHWSADPSQGGRIVGEACHFIDLARFLAASSIERVHAERLRPGDDSATITLGFASGAVASVHYLTNGHRSVGKERIEAFAGGRVYVCDNFRRTRAYGDRSFRTVRTARADKGQGALVRAFLAATRGEGRPPIPADELFEVAHATLLAAA